MTGKAPLRDRRNAFERSSASASGVGDTFPRTKRGLSTGDEALRRELAEEPSAMGPQLPEVATNANVIAPRDTHRHLLVSFCNVRQPGRVALGLVDLASREYRGLDINLPLPDAVGIAGIAASP